ncbi:MAG: hypothetical protein LBR06_01000, partial [Bacteroidales bacterium]|nr:hypothetical protein [Bacteroidales bacterium]
MIFRTSPRTLAFGEGDSCCTALVETHGRASPQPSVITGTRKSGPNKAYPNPVIAGLTRNPPFFFYTLPKSGTQFDTNFFGE